MPWYIWIIPKLNFVFKPFILCLLVILTLTCAGPICLIDALLRFTEILIQTIRVTLGLGMNRGIYVKPLILLGCLQMYMLQLLEQPLVWMLRIRTFQLYVVPSESESTSPRTTEPSDSE